MYESILEEIEFDKGWRNIEIKKIEIICQKLDNEDYKKLVLKSTIPIIYAHWEGFTVSSLRKVNKYLNSLNYKANDFHINLVANAYEKNLESLENSLGYEKRVKHLNIILNQFEKVIKFGTKVDVKSNLKFDVLKNICLKFNLNIENFKMYETDLEQLLQVRNHIAHGESSYEFEKYDDIEKYINLLSNLMDTLHIEINDFFKNEKYKNN